MLINNPPVEVTDGLWMLGINEYPLYLVRGQTEAAIFEGGVGCVGPLVLEQMEALAVDKRSLKQLIVPHGHPDHVMAIPLLREALPNLAVLTSELAAGSLASEKAISFFLKIDAALTESLLKAGRVRQEHRPKPLAEMRIGVDRIIQEGDTITVGEFRFDAIHTPGHGECNLSFHEPSRGFLLVSDAAGYYLPEHDSWWPDYFDGYAPYLDSMERLAGLGAETLCLGHNAVIAGAEAVKSHFDRSIAGAQQYHQRIVEQAKSGKPVRQIAEALGTEVYEKTPLLPLDFFQKNCNLLVRQSLKHEGIPLEK